MLTVNSLTFSYHAQVERADRIAIIDNHIGWGQIVKEVYFNGCYHCVTDTGLVLVVDDTRRIIITLYIMDRRKLHQMYNNRPPKYLISKVDFNVNHGWVQTYHAAMRAGLI